MGRKYKIHDQTQIYFVTFTVINWIDAFIRDNYKMILIDSIRYCQKEKGLQIHAWVIMTSHLHLIVSTIGEHKLEDIIRDLKSYTSKKIRLEIENCNYESRKDWMLWMFQRAGLKNKRNIDFQFWVQDNHPVELSSPEMLSQRLNYIHNNPVVAGFVLEPTHWKWSSAYDYAGGNQGLIDLVMIE